MHRQSSLQLSWGGVRVARDRGVGSVGSIVCTEVSSEFFEHLYILFYQPRFIDIKATFLPQQNTSPSLLSSQLIPGLSNFGEPLLLRWLSGIEETQGCL